MLKKLFSLCVALAFTLILAACSGGGAPAGAYDPDEEIAVLVFSTQEEADDARKALEARVSDQKDACEGYLPAELPKLEQAIVKESGSSVLLVVANDSQAAQAALDGLAQ